MTNTQFKAVLGVDLQMALCVYTTSTELALNQHQGATKSQISQQASNGALHQPYIHKNTIV